MNRLPTLAPSATFAELFPPRTVFAPRTQLQRMRWLHFEEHQLDHITGNCVSVLGDMPVICHRNTLTQEIRAFYEMAGIRLNGRYLTYASADEAIGLAKECRAQGLRLGYYYPPPDEIAGDDDIVVPQALYDWLNDKASIDSLCETAHLPRHRFFAPAELGQLVDHLPQQAVYVKLCHPGVSGGGADVRFCPDQASRLDALEWIAARPLGWSAVRVEAALDIRVSWCLNFGIGGAEGVRYLGAATQLFSAPAVQSGSLIDPQSLPSTATVRLGMEIGVRAQKLGYHGVAGFDIGETADGKSYVFDLNFRPAACTPQVLMHAAAAGRIGAKISQSWSRVVPGPLMPALRLLETFARNGQFVPLRLYDSTLAAGDVSRINGMLLASSLDEIEDLQRILETTLTGLTPML